MAGNRATIRIEVDPSDKTALGDVCERRGTTQIVLISRLVAWLSRQDETTQIQVLTSATDGSHPQLVKRLLRQLQSRRV